MKCKILTAVPSIIVSLLISSVVFAQDPSETSDRQYCEQQAEASGLSNTEGFQEYVEQCMRELQSENDDIGTDENNSAEDDIRTWD